MKKNVKQTDKTIFPTYDLDRIQDALLHDTSWIHTYSDKPVKQSGRGIKIGHGVGSLKVTIHGSNAGTWYDFTEQKGGGLINLLAHFHGKTFKQILPLAGHITNVHPTNEPLDMVRTKPKAIQKKEPALDKEAQERFDKAVNFVKESVPLKGTLAETYLRQHRGITGALPDSLTYHPAVNFYEKGKAYPALIGAVHHQDGSLSRAQFCFLDPKTGSKVARNLSRLTIGKGDAHGLTLTHNPSSKTVIMAEGIETGMSLLDAHPEHTVMVGFGQHFSRIELPKHIENVILAADNDGIETYKRSGYHALINKMQEENRDIQVAIPGNKGEDFNDVLKNEGKGSVRDSVQHAIGHATYTQLSVLHEHSVDPEVKKAEPSKVPTHSQAPISAPKPSIKHDFEIEI